MLPSRSLRWSFREDLRSGNPVSENWAKAATEFPEDPLVATVSTWDIMSRVNRGLAGCGYEKGERWRTNRTYSELRAGIAVGAGSRFRPACRGGAF
jgi:hypothetical protein